MEESKAYVLPSPVLDKKEERSIAILTTQYKKTAEPDLLNKVGKFAVELIPENLKKNAVQFADNLAVSQVYKKALSVVGTGFKAVEKQASYYVIEEKFIVDEVNKAVAENQITCLDEFCLARGYHLSKIVSDFKGQNLFLAMAGGVGTGTMGFVGLPAGIVLSVFLYYRAVQSVAMIYGFDVKRDPKELVIAGDVFVCALNPQRLSGDMAKLIRAAMENKTLEATDKNSETINEGMKKITALAERYANNELQKSGIEGIEYTVFKNAFDKIGNKVSAKALRKGIPLASAVLGAVLDTYDMNRIIDFANVFYNKRFLALKEENLEGLLR